VASTVVIASATGPPVGPMVGASVVAASAARVAVGDDLTIVASSCGTVASFRGSEKNLERGLESEALPGAVSESELYLGTGSLRPDAKGEPLCGPC
jgi:hypothetical protein